MHGKESSSEYRYVSSNLYICYVFIMTLSLTYIVVSLPQHVISSILNIPIALLNIRNVLILWLCGISFNDKTLIIRRLHQGWDFGLDAVVGLKRWKLIRLARLEIVEFGQVKKYYFAPSHFGLFTYILGRYNWKYAAYDDFAELMKQRIPENRRKHGLA